MTISDLLCFGGDKGNRTPDLMNANHALYYLSYTPMPLWYYTILFFICKVEKQNFFIPFFFIGA